MTAFEDAARAEAEAREMEAQHSADQWARRQGWALTGTEVGAYEQCHLAGSAWARDRLGEQERTERGALAEVLGRWSTGPALAQMVVAEVRGALAQDAAEQEASDAEVLAALNAHLVSGSPRANPAPSLDGYYAPENIDAVRAALRAAARIRKEQKR